MQIKNIQEFITIDCFWLANHQYPMESLAHFYRIDIEQILPIQCEGTYEFIPIQSLDLPLPYQKKVLELLKNFFSY